MNVWLKRQIFSCHIVIVIVAFLLLAVGLIYCWISDRRYNIAELVTAAGGIVSFVFFVQKQQLDELRLFSELFQKFNKRYAAINEDMTRLVTVPDNSVLTKVEDDTLNVYFNLCGEEYLYYKNGYVDPVVWTTWKNWMKHLLETNSRIQAKWQKEESTDSYYGLTRKVIMS